MLRYQEYPPCAALAPYLACLWTCEVRPDGQAITHRVLPDNCIDILWQDSDPHGGVAGMMSHAIAVPFARPARIIAARFKPGAASYFFDIPMHELADQHPALPELWRDGMAERCADALWTRPLTDAQAIPVIEQLLLQRLRSSRHAPGLVEAAVAAIDRSRGAIRIATLADTLGISRQHLATQFRTRVGLGAKAYARVSRFQHAHATIRARQTQPLDWAALALELGYYDQPHMIHEFQELAASSPQALIG
jgi:AraC-like DNA-binding protein